MSIGMVVVFVVMALPLLLSGSLLSLLQSIPGLPGFLHGGVAGLLIQVGAGVVDASLLFGIIYYVVPHRKQHVRDILGGAIAAGVLFEALTLVFPLYFKLVTNSPQWGQTFGLVFVLLFYFFLLSQIIMLGGALNAEVGRGHEQLRGARPHGRRPRRRGARSRTRPSDRPPADSELLSTG